MQQGLNEAHVGSVWVKVANRGADAARGAPCSGKCPLDLDWDGIVNASDLVTLLAGWIA